MLVKLDLLSLGLRLLLLFFELLLGHPRRMHWFVVELDPLPFESLLLLCPLAFSLLFFLLLLLLLLLLFNDVVRPVSELLLPNLPSCPLAPAVSSRRLLLLYGLIVLGSANETLL